MTIGYRLLGLALTALSVAAVAPALAQQARVPSNKPIRVIVPFSVGSATDGAARLFSDRLARAMNQPVFVDNKPGASGIIAAEAAAKSPADGTTIFFTTNTTQSANPNLFKHLPYDAVRDFSPVARLYILPLYLVARPQLQARTAGELIAASRKSETPFTFAYPNSSSRLAGESLRVAGGKISAVPYRTNPQALTDMLSGIVDFGFIDLPAAEPQVRAGRLRILGVMAAARVDISPEVPTIVESVPGFDVLSWGGVFVPSATPPATVQQLSVEFLRIAADPEMSRRLRELGYVVAPQSAAEFGRFAADQLAAWRAKVRAAGIEPE